MMILGQKNELPIHGDASPSQNKPQHQKLVNSTMGININTQLNNSGEIEVPGIGGPTGQNDNSTYQKGCTAEDISLAPSILNGYRSTASILQALHPLNSSHADDGQNATYSSRAIELQQPITNVSTHPKEQVSKVFNQSNIGTGQSSQKANYETHQLAGNGDPVIQTTQDQCQTTLMIQENASKLSGYNLNEPYLSNAENGFFADLSLTSVQPKALDDTINTTGLVTNVASPDVVTKVSTIEPLQPLGSQLPTPAGSPFSDYTQTNQQSQVQNNHVIPNSNPKISYKFSKEKPKKPKSTPGETNDNPSIQPNLHCQPSAKCQPKQTKTTP